MRLLDINKTRSYYEQFSTFLIFRFEQKYNCFIEEKKVAMYNIEYKGIVNKKGVQSQRGIR